MPVHYWNFEYCYPNSRGKPVFAPTDKGKAVGYKLKALVEERVAFDPFYYHLREGGHVAALHAHRPQRFFARVDIERFFYSVSKNRVASALHDIGIPSIHRFAKWSTVKNPYGDPPYSLPYGFVQSPILASLVLQSSAVGQFLRSIRSEVAVSVYVDDIAVSGDDPDRLDAIFKKLLENLDKANFAVNAKKTTATSAALELFNCDLRHLHSAVTTDRKADFYATGRTGHSAHAFDRYCMTVESGNS